MFNQASVEVLGQSPLCHANKIYCVFILLFEVYVCKYVYSINLDYFTASSRSHWRFFTEQKVNFELCRSALIALLALRLRTAVPDCKREMNQYIGYNKSKANPGRTGHDIQLWGPVVCHNIELWNSQDTSLLRDAKHDGSTMRNIAVLRAIWMGTCYNLILIYAFVIWLSFHIVAYVFLYLWYVSSIDTLICLI